PKGVVRDTGGHASALRWTMEHFYGCNPGDVMFASSDIGWVVGHSYIIYGPLLHGCTTVMFEGKPVGTPDPGVYWRIVQQHRDFFFLLVFIALFFSISKIREKGDTYSLLENDVTPTLYIMPKKILPSHVAVCDHWWQTETEKKKCFNKTKSFLHITTNKAIESPLPQKIGAAGQPIPGMHLAILPEVDHDNDVSVHDLTPLKANQTGEIVSLFFLQKKKCSLSYNFIDKEKKKKKKRERKNVLKLPLPPGTLSGIYNNPERTEAAYLQRYPGYYCTGDSGHYDEDGYVHVMSRVDDVIKVAGHRLSTATMEQVIAEHPSVAECAVIGVGDPFMKGEVPVGIAVRKSSAEDIPPERLERETVGMIREKIGAFACYKQTIIVSKLPKTRSGKILRRTLREIYDTGTVKAIPATIDDITAIDEFKDVLQRVRRKQESSRV
ncbi:hypothetical protein RFI_14849, partial [Reticulomyxa filosa]